MAPPSNIGFLEHVNLTLPPGPEAMKHARVFYLDILGCVEDPRPVQMMKRGDALLWANLGIQQFHLPVAKKAQVLRGIIGIETRDFEAVADNAVKHMKLGTLRGTEFSMRRTSYTPPLSFEGPQEALLFSCPWGNQFIVTHASPNGKAKGDKEFWVNPHDAQKSHGHPPPADGKQSLATGIRFIDLRAPFGSLPYIAKHYRDILGARCSAFNSHEGEDAVSGELAGRRKALVVWIGEKNDQWLVFREAGEHEKLPPYDGHHLAIYIGAFVHSHTVAEGNKLIYADHAFQHLDRAEDWEKVQQFRLLKVPDDEGNQIYELELEVGFSSKCRLRSLTDYFSSIAGPELPEPILPRRQTRSRGGSSFFVIFFVSIFLNVVLSLA